MSHYDTSAYITSDYYLRLRSEKSILCAEPVDNRVIEMKSSRIIKTLEVLKLRGFEQQTGKQVKFEIKPGAGILPA
jgi:archaellum biogenesis ATPase FlaH